MDEIIHIIEVLTVVGLLILAIKSPTVVTKTITLIRSTVTGTINLGQPSTTVPSIVA